MKFEITTNNKAYTLDVDAIAPNMTGVVTIGRKCKEVWNAITIDDESVDAFQCHMIGSGVAWKLNNGQERTECPKGLMSDRLIPCNGCMGRCVNVSPGRPKYKMRTPSTPTLINGQEVSEWGTQIKSGDEITMGNVRILVKE